MNILILGSGGREHTLCWKIKQSPLCGQLFVAPGNAGTASLATNVDVSLTDFSGLGKFAVENNIQLVIVGPEAPLVEGITDYFKNTTSLKNIHIIGPDKKGAQLEGSKDFSKIFMHKHGIPTATSRTFIASQIEEGLTYLQNHTLPIVLKADGLAAGKGVIIAGSIAEAQNTLKEMLLDKKFGDASSRVVIEQFLDGIEMSSFVITDGKNYVILPEAKDYKRIGEKDSGLNTGGMGAVSPVPFADEVFKSKVEEKVIKPTIKGLLSEGIHYVGFIFFGLMNIKGEPYVIEYNARLGDPETEVIIPRIKNDLVEILLAAAKGELSTIQVDFDSRTATAVMLVAGGYPEDYDKGKEITGLEEVKDVYVFHAGTTFNKEKKVVTNGGRVIAVTALGLDIKDALKKSNKAADTIQWDKKYFRRDIGIDLLALSGEKIS